MGNKYVFCLLTMMNKKILLLIFVACCFSSHAQLLKVKGTAIVNDKGENVLLRGMGLGGWMLQEGYMFRLSNIGQQYRIKEKITEVVGEEKANEFYRQWLLKHTTRQDIDSLAAWGFNSVRLPMHYNLYTLPVSKEPVAGQNTWLEQGFALTDSLLNWCKANKLYLILDLHAAPGGQGNDLPISDRNPNEPSLWESKANQEKTIALWRKLAERYKDEPWIGGYDIINEPNWGFEDPKNDFRGINENKNGPLKELMVAITNAIREVDTKHIVIIEGNGFGNNYKGILPPWDNNMVLSFHKYGNFNNEGSIRNFLDIREKYQLPLWLGESGENSNTWFTEAISLAEKNNIGWAWWQLKKMGINNPLQIKQPAGYDKLLAYWSGKGEKPTVDEAWTTLQQLLDNLEDENNIFHPDVVDAMVRQVQTNETKPFKYHSIGKKTAVQAVDFDLGKQRFAYYDKDSARYQYTPGVNTEGNRGYSYRNDGVDIQRSGDNFHISHIEDGEWLQYTIYAATKGNYTISLTTASEKDGSVAVEINNTKTADIPVLPTGGVDKWQTTKATVISLRKGENKLRLHMTKGGFSLSAIQIEKK